MQISSQKWLAIPPARLWPADRAPVVHVLSASRSPYSISLASDYRSWWCRGNPNKSWKRRWFCHPEKTQYFVRRFRDIQRLFTLQHSSAYSRPRFLYETLHFHVVSMPIVRVTCPFPLGTFAGRRTRQIKLSPHIVRLVAIVAALCLGLQVYVIPNQINNCNLLLSWSSRIEV